MNRSQHIRAAKRLIAATGYLELGLAQQALDCLTGITEWGDYQVAAQFLRGVALRALERYGEAVPELEAVALLVPPSIARNIWLTLCQCYLETGQTRMAVQSLAHARGANLASQSDA
jgi:hypothetical protein